MEVEVFMLKLEKFALTISLLLFLPLAAFGMEERTDIRWASASDDTAYSKAVLLASHDASVDGDKIRRPPFRRPVFINRGFSYGFYPYGFYPYGFYPFGFGFYPNYYLLEKGEGESSEGENWDGNEQH